MQITITMNPLKLIGRNKLEVLIEDQLSEFKERFAEEVQKIHNSLPKLDYWTINRIDYAVNINTPYVEEYIKLFQRADKPRSYKELYCSSILIAGSLLLGSNSVLNFYYQNHILF